ncbi:MAG: recombinase family protein, partial [Acidobacteriota bacterium]|nr:recombinase family protein [Acidobacteriota bacterium]
MANTDASSLARVVVYSRVSTQMQVEEGHSLDTQERLCREYVERKLAGRIAKIDFFREEGKSGACTVRQLRSGAEPVRPVLSDLVDAATQGEYTHLVTYEVSRVSREFQDWVMIHSLLLKPAGVKTLVMSGDLDLDDEDDEFVGNLLALVSDRERKLIRRRILDARESRRQAGYLPGGHPPYGWQWEPQDTVAPGAR